ncbi:tetratricopeptide repeat protein [bacterium]|nr:tetratricopeptide repeat protein [bacterium]
MSEDRIEVSAQIMETESKVRQGQPIRVDGLFTNPHQVASTLAGLIRDALKIEAVADGVTAKPAPASLDAYRYYLEGMDAAYDRRHEESIDKLIRATTLDTTFIKAFYKLAWQYGEIGNREISMEILAKIKPHIASLSEKDRLGYFREKAKYERRWTDYALYLERLLSLDPFDAMDHYRYGWVQAYKFRRHDAGIASIQKSLQLDSTFAEAHNRLGYIFLAKGDKQQAHALIDKYLDLNPADVNPLDSKAEIQLYTGLYNEAARNCQRILDMKPDFLRSRRVLIQVLMAQGRYAQALQEVSRYMTLATSLRDMSKGQSLQAEVHLQLGELEKALNLADQAVTLDSTNVQAHWRRARILTQLKNTQAAEQEVAALNRALETWGALDGKWFLHHAKGVIALQEGAFDRAKEQLRSALQLGPWDRSFYTVALAEAYAIAGQWLEAVGEYHAALAFNPNNAAAAFGLARAHEQLDQVTEAKDAFSKALNIWSQADHEVKQKQVAKTKMASLNN